MLFTSQQMRAYHQPGLKNPPPAFKRHGKKYAQKLEKIRGRFVEHKADRTMVPGSRPLMVLK